MQSDVVEVVGFLHAGHRSRGTVLCGRDDGEVDKHTPLNRELYFSVRAGHTYVHTVGHTGNEDSSLCVRVEGSAEGSHSSNVPGDPPKASFSTHPIYLAFICMYVCTCVCTMDP